MVFTAGIGRRWPRTHHIAACNPDRFVIELREGGRWFERGVDGVECEIRKVRILLLAWSSTGNSAPTLRLIPR